MLSALRLARWLGPWTRPTTLPPGVNVSTLRFGGDRALTGRLYAPRGRQRGAYLMCPGLHPLGPEHPVLDRFCRVLAASGFLVLSPGLPDHQRTRLTDQAVVDLGLAFDALRARPDVARPAIFAVSYGVLPALRFTADPARADQVAGLLLYGGYADVRRSFRFVLTGQTDGAPDREPDVRLWPVTLMNLPELPGVGPERTALHRAWLAWMAETWLLDGTDRALWWQRADHYGRDLPESLRSTYRMGCGLEPGALELVRAYLDENPAFIERFSAATYAPRVRAPVVILHGSDDPVVPASEALALRDVLAPHTRVEAHITGLYGHTRLASLGEILRMGRALWRELHTAWQVVRGIARLARRGNG